MEIESIRHKALREFYLTGRTKGLNAQVTPRLTKMFQFLEGVKNVEELLVPPNYGAHELTGDRAGIWSLVVTRNWRMTFTIDEQSIHDVDLEDYH